MSSPGSDPTPVEIPASIAPTSVAPRSQRRHSGADTIAAVRRLLALAASVLALPAAGAGVSAGAAHAPAARSDKALSGLGIHHVFVIVLENESYAATYVHNPNPNLGKILQRQGTLLTEYYATGHASLDNYLSMISGQAPNPVTSADCPEYLDFNGPTLPADLDGTGQAGGIGCVFPANV